eukprot:SAG11_NODE_13388_length_657_cov_3.243728_1_plen_165_part_00
MAVYPCAWPAGRRIMNLPDILVRGACHDTQCYDAVSGWLWLVAVGGLVNWLSRTRRCKFAVGPDRAVLCSASVCLISIRTLASFSLSFARTHARSTSLSCLLHGIAKTKTNLSRGGFAGGGTWDRAGTAPRIGRSKCLRPCVNKLLEQCVSKKCVSNGDLLERQ